MANQYSALEYAFIEDALDENLDAGDGAVDLILNFLGDGLCAWCERAASEGSSHYCEDCIAAFDSFDSPANVY